MSQGRIPLRLTRRRLIGGAIAIAGVSAATTGAAFLLGGDHEKPAHPGAPTPVASPTPAAPPSPTPAGLPAPLGFLRPSTGALQRVSFKLTDTIDWRSGVFYMDTASGDMTAYRRSADDGAVFAMGPRFVVAPWRDDNVGILFDRETAREWTFDSNRWRPMAASGQFVVFSEMEENRDAGRYVLAKADITSGVEYRVGVSTWSRWTIRESLAAVTFQALPDRLEFVDLRTGASRTAFTAPPRLGELQPWGIGVHDGGDGTLSVVVTYMRGDPGLGKDGGPPSYLVQRLGWDGALLDVSDDWRSAGAMSPGGAYLLREVQLHTKPSTGEGSGENWPAVVVRDREGRDLLRIRSATLTYGDDLPGRRWLADGSGFVAMVADPVPVVPSQPYGYAVISAEGGIDLLPVPPVDTQDWYGRPAINGPVPSPHDPDLLSFGRFYLYNRQTGSWFVPRLTDRNGPAHWLGEASPWEARIGEMVFALGHGGHGGINAPSLVAPLVERAPFPAEPRLRFRVERAGSCLSLREKPDEAAAVIGCLKDGAVLDLDLDGQVFWEGGQQGYIYGLSQGGAWVLVRTAAGQRGWLSSAYLGWAVS